MSLRSEQNAKLGKDTVTAWILPAQYHTKINAKRQDREGAGTLSLKE